MSSWLYLLVLWANSNMKTADSHLLERFSFPYDVLDACCGWISIYSCLFRQGWQYSSRKKSQWLASVLDCHNSMLGKVSHLPFRVLIIVGSFKMVRHGGRKQLFRHIKTNPYYWLYNPVYTIFPILSTIHLYIRLYPIVFHCINVSMYIHMYHVHFDIHFTSIFFHAQVDNVESKEELMKQFDANGDGVLTKEEPLGSASFGSPK